MTEIPGKITGHGPLTETFSFRTAKRILFGLNTCQDTGEEIRVLGGKRPLIVSDKGILGSGVLDKVIDHVEDEGLNVEIFNDLTAEPTIQSMQEAIKFVRRIECDTIVGVGGGSSMDTAKIAAIMKTNQGQLGDYLQKQKTFEHPRLPLVLVPTTAGTGSEVTGDAVLFVNGKKRWIADSKLLPDAAVVDPLLSVTMPPRITASTGSDALCHAVEAMMTTRSNPLSDTLALKAIELITRNIERACNMGKDVTARYNMMLAATIAGISSENASCTLPHSIGYTLAFRYKLPHGISCAIALPYAMKFNLPQFEEKCLSISSKMGIKTEGFTRRERALEAINAIKSLMVKLGVPSSLKEIGVPENQLKELAEEFLSEYPRPYNIREVNRKNIFDLYEEIWKGDIN
jgi:alcohol dehydrogenase class IV